MCSQISVLDNDGINISTQPPAYENSVVIAELPKEEKAGSTPNIWNNWQQVIAWYWNIARRVDK